MNLVFAMILSIGIKGISAIVEIAIQMLITNGVGVSEYGEYTFFVSLIEGAYFVLFSGSIKLNTFYLSTSSASLSKFKIKYTLYFVAPIIAMIIVVFAIMKNPYGVLSGIILYIYYFAFDTSSVFFSRGKQLPALLGEYLFGRIVLLVGILAVIKMNKATGIILLALYGLQFVTMLLWFAPYKQTLNSGSEAISVPLKKLVEYQMSDVANSLICYSPTILQYVIGGAFTAGFTGIISIVKRFINFISGPTAKVFLPEFSRLYKNGQKEKLEQSYLMIVRIQMVFIGTIGCVLIGFPHLILKMFSPDLIQYSSVFTVAACSLLLVAGIGPVTGMLQMTGSEQICNRNQWVSIGGMVLVWILLRKEPLFAVYGLCVQAVIEGGMKYYAVCQWFGRNIVPIKNYILLWLPVLIIRIMADSARWQDSFIALALSTGIVLVWNVAFAMCDPMIKNAVVGKLKTLHRKKSE